VKAEKTKKPNAHIIKKENKILLFTSYLGLNSEMKAGSKRINRFEMVAFSLKYP
jgi:hypothetical protein